MRDKLIAALKRWGEIAGALTVTFALLGGIFSFLGAKMPPWESWADAQELKQQVGGLNVTQALLARSYYSDKLDDAQAELSKHPDSQAAKAVVRDMRWKIRVIDSQLLASAPSAGPAPKS